MSPFYEYLFSSSIFHLVYIREDSCFVLLGSYLITVSNTIVLIHCDLLQNKFYFVTKLSFKSQFHLSLFKVRCRVEQYSAKL
jgi:hypothetical protein